MQGAKVFGFPSFCHSIRLSFRPSNSTYIFTKISLKLWCLGHEGVYIIYILSSDIFYYFFHKMNLVIFLAEVKKKIVGILCMQLLLQFYSDSFETLQVFRA